MSRIRSIHPGLWTDEAFVTLSAFARLLFISMWNECDDKGIFVWSPLQLKMRCLPGDNADAAALLSEIETAGFVLKYEVGGKFYGAVRNFAKFQRPKKPNDVHPATAEVLAFAGHGGEPMEDAPAPVPNQLPTGGEKPPQMKEEGGKEVSPPTPRKRGSGERQMLPSDWEAPLVADLSPQAQTCAAQWTGASYATHAEAFKNYWRSERKMKADWNGTWANRVVDIHDKVMRAQKFGNAPPDTPKATADPNAGKAFARYQAGEISFEEFDRSRRESEPRRTASTGPPRPIGQLLPRLATG